MFLVPRVSVPIDVETLAVFDHLAAVTGMSRGQAIALWLADTSSSARSYADKVSLLRSSLPDDVSCKLAIKTIAGTKKCD